MTVATAKRIPIELKASDIKDMAEGSFSAVFSTFDIIDADGDVVRRGAIPQVEVPVVWGHDWHMMPVGKGLIRTTGQHAIIDGRFSLQTQQGKEAWETLRFMGGVQQYSWGFEVTEESFGEKDGRKVRFIDGTRPMEVSPVLVGSNPETGTLSVKAGERCPTCGAVKSAGADEEEAQPAEAEQEADRLIALALLEVLADE